MQVVVEEKHTPVVLAKPSALESIQNANALTTAKSVDLKPSEPENTPKAKALTTAKSVDLKPSAPENTPKAKALTTAKSVDLKPSAPENTPKAKVLATATGVDLKPSAPENTPKAKALTTPKGVDLSRRSSIYVKSSTKPKGLPVEGTMPPTIIAVASKTPSRQDRFQAGPDHVARLSAELQSMKKELTAFKKLFHTHFSKPPHSTDRKNTVIATESVPKTPISWYCTYNSGENNKAPCVETSPDAAVAVPKLDVLVVDKMPAVTQLSDPSAIPGFVALHRSTVGIQDQGKNTENILYAGLLHFTIPHEAQAGIAVSIQNNVSPTQLCKDHPAFAQAKIAATTLCKALETKHLSPTCWCTGADGFGLVWQDTTCFLRFKKHKVVDWSRCVDVFLQTYLDAATLQAITGKFEHWNGVLDTRYASSYTYHIPTSPSVPFDAPAQLPVITQTMIVSTKLSNFWRFLLHENPSTLKDAVRLPRAAVPNDSVDPVASPKTVLPAADGTPP